jgi:uronate dehydrogenase
MDGARALGYQPRDDAEAYAAQILAAGQPDPADPAFRYLGGEFTLPSRDAPVPPR